MDLKQRILELIEIAQDFEKKKIKDKLLNIVNSNSKEIHKSKPNKIKVCVEKITETAFQRAILFSKKTKLNTLGEISWKDIELPIVFNGKSRRTCVDLIGTLNDNKQVLCELKFASKKKYYSDSPIYAIIELLIYYYLIKENCKKLDKNIVFHTNAEGSNFEWSAFDDTSIFIVAANESYFSYWKNRYKGRENEIKKILKDIPINIQLFSSSDFNFEKHKGVDNLYNLTNLDRVNWTEEYLFKKNNF